jgi:phage head maturation protease
LRRAPFSRTLIEDRAGLKVLFQHGRDPQAGNKPLGPIDTVREDGYGAFYRVPLLDTTYNRDLLPGLEIGLYGASFRFQVMMDEVVERPGRSAHNPTGLPERTVGEAKLFEFGPVTFPAYSAATALIDNGEANSAGQHGELSRGIRQLRIIAGQGMVVARHGIRAGATTRYHPDHRLVRANPDRYTAADPADRMTAIRLRALHHQATDRLYCGERPRRREYWRI